MSLTKFLIIILAVTLLASLYVHQQIRIVQLAYQEQETLACLKDLIDENYNLKYNINRQTSLVSIVSLWQTEDFEWPHREQLVSLPTVPRNIEDNRQTKESESIFARLFRLKAQAEATSIKPRVR